jgi:hypothetical protein
VNRRAILVPIVAVLALAASAQAQVARLSPVSLGPVTFTVDDADLAAAQGCPGCVVIAQDPGPGVVFDVRRQNPNRVYVLDVALDGWTPACGPTLEVQLTVTSVDGRTTYLQTGWTEVTEGATALFDQNQANQARVRVTASYRLRLGGDETAGTFTSPVTYRIRGTTETATHATQVGLPTFLAIRWAGTPSSGSATLRFEYATRPMTYLDAVTSGTPLTATSADFARLEVSTNHPSGYAVTVLATSLDAPIGAASLAPRLTIAGAAADGRRFVSSGPTDGFVTLATPDDFGLIVNGTETPGTYRIELTYEATRNP